MKALLWATLRTALPYALAASAGLICERSGVINLALEGFMLWGAFAAAYGTLMSGQVVVGVVAALLVAIAIGLLYDWVIQTGRADQVLVGIAFNLMAVGATRFLLKVTFNSASNSPRVSSDVPVAWYGVAALIGLYWLLEHSVFSRRLIAAGDCPTALMAAGLSPVKTRRLAIVASAMVASLAGMSLIFAQHQFTDGMTAGRGYIAVAAVVFGGWRLWPTWLTCLLFALAEALQLLVQSHAFLPNQVVQMLPYVVCLLALGIRRKSFRPPLELGVSA